MDDRRPVVLGFSGRAGSGKSTACAYLTHTLGAVEIAFADQLKEICHKLFQQCGVTRDAWYGSQVDKSRIWDGLGGLSGRQVLQRVGTDCLRGVNPDVWARFAEARALTEIEAGAPAIVFSDVRFPEEADAIHRLGGKVVRLTRNTPTFLGRLREHVSERSLDNTTPDFVIDNRRTSVRLLRVQAARIFCALTHLDKRI